MNIGERIRQIRKEARLTLRAFGDRIAITNGALSQIENGRANPSDQTIRLICREFGVSETWLRTGAGEVFAVKSRDEEVTEAVNRLLTGEPAEFRRRLVLLLSRLNVDQWEQLQKYASELVGENPAAQGMKMGAGKKGPMSDEEIEAEVEAYRQELYAEKRVRDSLPPLPTNDGSRQESDSKDFAPDIGKSGSGGVA